MTNTWNATTVTQGDNNMSVILQGYRCPYCGSRSGKIEDGNCKQCGAPIEDDSSNFYSPRKVSYTPVNGVVTLPTNPTLHVPPRPIPPKLSTLHTSKNRRPVLTFIFLPVLIFFLVLGMAMMASPGDGHVYAGLLFIIPSIVWLRIVLNWRY